jgi:hypothetical protein
VKINIPDKGAPILCPVDFGWREALIVLYAIQHYEIICKRSNKTYGPGIFYSHAANFLSGLRNKGSRKTILNHLNNPVCVKCGVPIDIKGKVLDHIIPKHAGGTDDLGNMMVLCKSHNSSKGKKDLIEWWIMQGWDVQGLPRDILCLYARDMWQHLIENPIACTRLPGYIRTFINERVKSFPSAEHVIALYRSTYRTIGLLRPEEVNGD